MVAVLDDALVGSTSGLDAELDSLVLAEAAGGSTSAGGSSSGGGSRRSAGGR